MEIRHPGSCVLEYTWVNRYCLTGSLDRKEVRDPLSN